ncbi:cytochrome P450 2U1-like [Anneissia japonica]|uniref:cytochrome P450 2U1-like n=1 Tax=Anneissia japonica TaxID=1529436 RepID=UPI0014259BD2|nr:cytochrome P450 2U1-like [Anneissia japonica]
MEILMETLSGCFSGYKLQLYLIFAIVFFLTYRLLQCFQDKRLPPRGPRDWPIVGILPSLAGKAPYKRLANMSKKYGSIFGGNMGSISTIFISDFALLKEAFGQPGHLFSGRPNITLFELSKGRGIGSAYYGQQWKEHRKFTVKLLRHFGMGKRSISGRILTEVDFFMSELSNMVDKPCKLDELTSNAVANIIYSIAFGERFEYTDENFRKLQRITRYCLDMMGSAGIFNYLPFLRYIPGSSFHTFHKYYDEFCQFVDKRLMPPSTNDPAEAKSFIDAYFIEMDRKQANQEETTMAKDALLFTIVDLIAGGSDTTSSTMKFMMMYSIVYKDVQRKIQEEIDTVVGHQRNVVLEDIDNLPFTCATVYEVMRMTCSVPLGVPHSTTKETVFNGYHIPKGVQVIGNLYSIMHDPSTWESPEEFKPERFLSEDGRKVQLPKEWIPFGIGSRRCPGEPLGKSTVFLFFTNLLHGFNLDVPEGAPKPNLQPVDGITLQPESCNVILSHRSK